MINFLLNSKEGVDILGLERGVPLSKAAVTYLTEDGVIKADDPAVSGLKLAQSLPTALPVSLTSTIRRSSPSSAPPCSTSTTVKVGGRSGRGLPAPDRPHSAPRDALTCRRKPPAAHAAEGLPDGPVRRNI